MTLEEMKKKVTRLIEEVSTSENKITDDPDIDIKLNDAINLIQFELARMKKIPDYVEIEATENGLIRFSDITEQTGCEVYQLDVIRGLKYELKANGTIIKALEDGTAEIDYFRYPTRIDDKTIDKTYEFELSDDALEVGVLGVAGLVLSSDVSNNYGQIYTNMYREKLQTLDPRYAMGSISFEGGIDV